MGFDRGGRGRGGGAGFSRGGRGGGGGFRGGRGGFGGGGRGGFEQGPPDYVDVVAEFSHVCEGLIICMCTDKRVPLL